MKAWLFQDVRQKQKLGDKCPWSVGWFDPDGKKRSKRIGCESRAKTFARKIEGQLAAGTYESDSRKKWDQFRPEYERRVLALMPPQTQEVILQSLDKFQEIVEPAKVAAIRTATIDDFIGKRREERGRKPGSKVSPATINKDLRHLKAALKVAQEWGYLPKVPKIRMVKEPKKLARFVSPEHFAAMYKACDVAVRPAGQEYAAAEWWRGVLMFAYMTGWRISEIVGALTWDDVSLDGGHAITRHGDNKGKRDERVPLHPVVIEHLRKLVDLGPVVFPWSYGRRMMYDQFGRIQDAAGIDLPCPERHEHTEACHHYGFHDFRRAFATMNADRLTGDALQALMRHKSYTTTQRYINMARQLDQSVKVLYVPDLQPKEAEV
ncbi:MAG: tyrosine-type recombinase/integrase [Thermoguttaceae bacterium]|jgi:integrase